MKSIFLKKFSSMSKGIKIHYKTYLNEKFPKEITKYENKISKKKEKNQECP